MGEVMMKDQAESNVDEEQQIEGKEVLYIISKLFKHKDVHKKAHTKTCSLIDPPANILNLK